MAPPLSGPGQAVAENVKMTGRCTSCQKTYTLTEDQQKEGAAMGCAFSPCCKTVATIERVEVRDSPGKPWRRQRR